MALDERARYALFLRLEEALGVESAETLMELLPPVGWADVATKHDLAALEDRMTLRFEVSEQRFLAAFRGELLAQSNLISGQMRALVIANVGSVLSIAALAFGVARLT